MTYPSIHRAAIHGPCIYPQVVPIQKTLQRSYLRRLHEIQPTFFHSSLPNFRTQLILFSFVQIKSSFFCFFNGFRWNTLQLHILTQNA